MPRRANPRLSRHNCGGRHSLPDVAFFCTSFAYKPFFCRGAHFSRREGVLIFPASIFPVYFRTLVTFLGLFSLFAATTRGFTRNMRL